jgi:hypothetical protein
MSVPEDLPTTAGTYDADEADRVEQALPVFPEDDDGEESPEVGVTEADDADVAEQRRPVPSDPTEEELG